MPNTIQQLTADDVRDALGDDQRRNLLFDLHEFTARDGPPPTIVVSDRDADPVSHLVSMKQTHIPKLERYGIIDWNEERHEVTKGPNFEQIEPLLERMKECGGELPEDWTWPPSGRRGPSIPVDYSP